MTGSARPGGNGAGARQRHGGTTIRVFWNDLVRLVLLARTVGDLGVRLLVDLVFRRARFSAAAGASLRRVLGRAGMTYVKLGQYLAMRFDVLPTELCRELDGLLDQVPAAPPSAIAAALEEQFGVPHTTVFAEFDPIPLGSASLAQVHRAVSHDGRVVAVKVQRPGLLPRLHADFRNLRRLATLIDAAGLLAPVSARDLIRELESFTTRELDFEEEGRVTEALGTRCGGRVGIPRVHWDLCRPRVLTQGLVEGTPLTAILNGRLESPERSEPGNHGRGSGLPRDLDLPGVLRTIADAVLFQIFELGLFHGDPHPANVIVDSGGRVHLVDFGLHGSMPRRERDVLRQYLTRLVAGDVEGAFSAWAVVAPPTLRTDPVQYRSEMTEALREWRRAVEDPSARLTERHMASFQARLFTIMRQNEVAVPMSQVLFWRVLMVLDSLGLRLPKPVDMVAVAQEYLATQIPVEYQALLACLEPERLSGQRYAGYGVIPLPRSHIDTVLNPTRHLASLDVIRHTRGVTGLLPKVTKPLTAALVIFSVTLASAWAWQTLS